MAEARIKVEFDKSGAEKEIKELQSRIEELKTEVDNMEKYATYKKCADEMFLVKKLLLMLDLLKKKPAK